MAISNSKHGTPSIQIFGILKVLPNSTGSRFHTLYVNEIVIGKQLGFVMDHTGNKFTHLMKLPLNHRPSGAQQWIDVTAHDLRFLI